MSGKREWNERGVTVIVGTLMLILVTVTAAAGLAVMVSQMQKDEMNRQSHQAAVKNEQLKITGIQPAYNGTTGLLEDLNITILNLNTAPSRINLLGLGDRTFPAKFSSSDGVLYNNTRAGYEIPAAQQGVIVLRVADHFSTNPAIARAAPLRVFVITSYYNTFEQTFKPPVADFQLKIEREDLGVAERDVIILDGSASADDGSIVTWNWSVYDNGVLLAPLYGKTVRFVPTSKGPFTVQLTVTDDSGMQGITQNKTVPLNPRFFPATYLSAQAAGNNIIVTVTDLNTHPVENATVSFIKFYDVHGNLSLSSYSGSTSPSGQMNVTVLGGEGTIRVESGTLQPVYVPVKYLP